jgi:hypothetical protein
MDIYLLQFAPGLSGAAIANNISVIARRSGRCDINLVSVRRKI